MFKLIQNMGGRMILLEKIRREKGLSQSALAKLANLNQATVWQAERRGLQLGQSQLARLANVLDWENDPLKLLKDSEVE
jgi:transcriptional regulator with XRE-family HTH domain